MKKIYTLIFLLAFSISTHACEICGCGNSNFQIGLLPSFNKYFFGLRYASLQYNSTMREDSTQYSRDHYQSLELWGGYLFKKVQVMAFVPYLYANKVSDDGTLQTNGLGDAILIVNYLTWSKKLTNKAATRTLSHELWMGGGIKLPTGKNSIDLQSLNVGDFNSQPGTGSTDYLVNATYNFYWNNSGIVTNVTYRQNTANSQGFKFGNRLYFSSSYFRTFTWGKTKIRPTAGANYVASDTNKFAGAIIEDSNGYQLNAILGCNIVLGKVGVLFNSFVPVDQNMNNGQTKMQNKNMVTITYSW